MRSSGLPYDISIPEPCPADWHGMQPVSSAVRHCDSCARQVHDLSRLSAREVRRLVDHTGGQFCARVTHRQDGSLLLREAPARSAAWPGAGLVLAAALASAGVAVSAEGQTVEISQRLADAHPNGKVQARNDSAATAPENSGNKVQVNDPEPVHVALGGLIRPVPLLGFLQGNLQAPNGSPVHAGTLTLTSARGHQYMATVTMNGQFQVLLPPGKYTAAASVQGSQGANWYGTESIRIKQGDQQRDFRPSEPVQVTAGVPLPMPVSQARTTK